MKNKFDTTNLIFILVLSILLLGSLLWNTEVLHMESASFLYNYTGDRPLLNMIFDPLNNDWGLYQGRELSYFIDYLDANFIAACAKWRMAHFYSLSFFIISILIIVIQQYYGNLLFRNLSKIEIFAGTCLLMSMPIFVLNSSFFRSAKPLCSLFLCLISYFTLLLYYRGMIFKNRKNNLLIWTIIAVELLMVISDKQGVFFVAAFGMIFAIFLIFSFILPKLSIPNNRSLLFLALGTAGVLLISVLYNGMICPQIIYALNGYYPNFDFQKPQAINISVIFSGLAVFLKFIGTILSRSGLFGGIAVLIVILLTLGIPLYKYSGNLKKRWYTQRFYILSTFILLFSAISVMFILMTSRLPELVDFPELICSSYIMPTMIVLFFFIMLSLNCWQRGKSKSYGKAIVVLFLILSFVNIMTIPYYIDLMHKGHMKFCYMRTPAVLNIINSDDKKIKQALLPAEVSLIKRLCKDQISKK